MVSQRLEAAVSDVGSRSQQSKLHRRSGKGSWPRQKPDVFWLPASESNAVTWRLIVFTVISAAIPAVALLGSTLNVPSLESGIPGVTRMNPNCAERIRTAIGAGAFRIQDGVVFEVTISIGALSTLSRSRRLTSSCEPPEPAVRIGG